MSDKEGIQILYAFNLRWREDSRSNLLEKRFQSVSVVLEILEKEKNALELRLAEQESRLVMEQVGFDSVHASVADTLNSRTLVKN